MGGYFKVKYGKFYVLCEIITGAIVFCFVARKWLYFISSFLLLLLPCTGTHSQECQVVYICVKYYCNNNGNNLFMSFSFPLRPVCRLLAGWFRVARATSRLVSLWFVLSGFQMEQTVRIEISSLSFVHFYKNEPFINALSVLCSE